MFANFAVLWLFAKVFSTKFGGMASFGVAQVSNQRKFYPRKLYFSPIRKSFQFLAIRYTHEESTTTFWSPSDYQTKQKMHTSKFKVC